MGSWERVREWSHDRWGEPLEVEDLLPDYLLAGEGYCDYARRLLLLETVCATSTVPAVGGTAAHE